MLRLYIWAIKNYTLYLQCVLLKIHAHCRKLENKDKSEGKKRQNEKKTTPIILSRTIIHVILSNIYLF